MNNDAALGIIRQWMGDLIAPSEAWSYLWKPSHERGLSDALDLACGYEEGTAGWVLDAAFYGKPLFVPRWLEEWPLNDQPLLAVCARGRPQDGGFKHGIFLRSPLEKFLDAYLKVGRWDFVKVGDWATAAKQATGWPHSSRPSGRRLKKSDRALSIHPCATGYPVIGWVHRRRRKRLDTRRPTP